MIDKYPELSEHERWALDRIQELEQALRDIRDIAEIPAGNRKYMQVAGPARQIINRVNRVLPK